MTHLPPQQQQQYPQQQQVHPPQQQPYPQQPPHPQQQPYQQQPYQQQPYQQQSPAAAPVPPGIRCRCCGSVPAKEATFRGHRGIIIVMQFLSQKGPFCRDCGIATFRGMTSRTFIQGWWGFASFLITPFVLAWNFLQRLKFNNMPAPQPTPGSIAPMPVGKPLFLRPTVAGLAVPLAAVAFIVFSVATSDPNYPVGQCVKVSASESVDIVSCDKTNNGQIISVVSNEDACGGEASGVVEQTTTRKGRVVSTEFLCIK